MSSDKMKLDAELKELNLAVADAVAKRKAWMDDHMPDYARFQIGEEVFDCKTGQRLGVISRHYRYWDEQGHQNSDKSMNIEYEIHKGDNIYDNTSRYAGLLRIGNAKDLVEEKERELRMAKYRLEGFDWEEVFSS